jgi:hypothetical protein
MVGEVDAKSELAEDVLMQRVLVAARLGPAQLRVPEAAVGADPAVEQLEDRRRREDLLDRAVELRVDAEAVVEVAVPAAAREMGRPPARLDEPLRRLVPALRGRRGEPLRRAIQPLDQGRSDRPAQPRESAAAQLLEHEADGRAHRSRIVVRRGRIRPRSSRPLLGRRQPVRKKRIARVRSSTTTGSRGSSRRLDTGS